jgi:isopenicillin-N epimerase
MTLIDMPAFGHAMRDHWVLDPEYTYLNHGTVGAPPRRVLERQQALRDELERQPARFMLRELAGLQLAPWRAESRIREAARSVAGFLGSRSEDLVFVSNATTGLNAVLRSIPLAAGDEVVMTDLAYGAIALAAGFATRERGATLRVVEMPYPVRDPNDIVEAIISALTPRTKLAVVDHITPLTALVLPVTAIVAACHAHGVPVLVDGAHAPGSLPLDISYIGADWYVANLHKWAHAPRACGVLWAAPDRQGDLHHPVVSWGFGQGFREEFEWNGTSDPTNYLAAPEGIALLREWGFDAVLDYLHSLAWEAASVLTDCWHTTMEAPRAMVGAMVTVPLPEAAGATEGDAARLRLALLVDDRIEVQLHAWRGRLWVRVSAQVYNDRSDMVRLAEAVSRQLRGGHT